MPELEPGPPTRAVLPRGLTYFEYQRLVCRDVVVPWLATRIALSDLDVGDFGAHQGGMLEALRESGVVASATGLELNPEIVASSPFVGDERFRLEVGDLMARDPDAQTFDVVLLHDVLEHVPDLRGALRSISDALRGGGHCFVSFPPYYASFGGHQQLAAGRARVTPFVHILPRRVFLRLARPSANEYMSADSALADMLSVRRTRLSIRRAERAFRAAGLEITDRELFLVRPEHSLRYGVKTRRASLVGRVPWVRELLVNGAFYLLRRPG